MTRAVLFLALSAVAACRSTQPIPDSITGSWQRVPAIGQPPGSSEQITLRLLPQLPPGLPRGQFQVAGVGHWAGEAGPFGTSTADGRLVADSVSLSLTYTPDPMFAGLAGHHAVFIGRLISESELAGTIAYDGAAPVAISFRKLVQLN